MIHPGHKNALEIIKISSEARALISDELEHVYKNEFVSLFERFFLENIDSFIVAWLDYKVVFGIFANSSLSFFDDIKLDKKFIQKIRIFNESKELMIWRNQDGFKGRFRQDYFKEGNCDVIVAYQKLFGTKIIKKQSNDKFTTITEEDRGTTITLPMTGIEADEKDYIDPGVCLKIHNYVDKNCLNQATYVDCRFVKFCNILHIPHFHL